MNERRKETNINDWRNDKKKELVIEHKNDNPFNSKHETKIITGTSLYYADESILFVHEYIKQIEKITVYGYLYWALKNQSFEKKIGAILSFQKISKKIANIVGTEVTNLPIIMIIELRKNVDEINTYLQSIENKIENIIWDNDEIKFKINTSFSGFKIDLKKVKPESNEIIDSFNESVGRLLSTEWIGY